jgi:hypothetical protein
VGFEKIKALTNSSSLNDMTNELYNIYGAFWNKGSSPSLTRIDSARGAVATAGIDNIPAYNQFDITPP